MKKILCLVLVISMFFGFSSCAFARGHYRHYHSHHHYHHYNRSNDNTAAWVVGGIAALGLISAIANSNQPKQETVVVEQPVPVQKEVIYTTPTPAPVVESTTYYKPYQWQYRTYPVY